MNNKSINYGKVIKWILHSVTLHCGMTTPLHGFPCDLLLPEQKYSIERLPVVRHKFGLVLVVDLGFQHEGNLALTLQFYSFECPSTGNYRYFGNKQSEKKSGSRL
ncbi:MAG: hypothetical protein HGB36_09810 [Chlorobiaceae bacterium]|jgi:hypothetical protein|nr:hypothetical protein [Chlorobiaceae bacterium]